MSGVAIPDTSPIIGLHQIGQLELLRLLFGQVMAPPAVAREVAPSVMLPLWVEVRPPPRPLDPRLQEAQLDPGETEAMALALDVHPELLIIDDLRGRRLAQRLGLTITGTAGVLVRAKTRGLIPAVRPLLDEVVAAGLFLGPDIYRLALEQAGEAP